MRDYAELVKCFRCCAEIQCETCPRGDVPNGYIECRTRLADETADAIEELLAKDTNVPNKWISVEERLPEDQGDDARAARGGDYIHKVLAASVTPNYTVMDTAYLENGIWSLSKYTSWKQIIGAPVTHWMPLPTSPGGTE